MTPPISYLVRRTRLRARLTQVQAAARLGVTQGNWSRWETGERIPALPTLEAIAEALGFQLVVRMVPRREEDIITDKVAGGQ